MTTTRRNGYPHIPYRPPQVDSARGLEQGRAFLEALERRRSVRFFSEAPVPREMIELAIRVASTAPSGAHQQPWTFVAISDPGLQFKIREAAEVEERASYAGRMSEEWLEALEPLGTDWRKPFLETVPWIVVVFEQRYGIDASGSRRKHFYVRESVGIACGLFVAALHEMGLSTLTHTPSPMGFLTEILERPVNEKPFILFPVGYAADDATVPDLRRKSLEQVSIWRTDR
jgi:iodotyrosine deiodinase